jgi:D-3-phosphoglycerate dehydrogenase
MPSHLPAPARPVVGLAATAGVFERYVTPADLARLEAVAEVRFRAFELPGGRGSGFGTPNPDPAAHAALEEFLDGLDALVVCHGAPRVTAADLDAHPRLAFVGELEGDRLGGRIDVEAAAARGVVVVDTTHGSSWPVAEWALALMMIGLRDAGELFRRLVDGELVFATPGEREASRSYGDAELSGKRVGLLGFGHIAWRLVELLAPFDTEVLAYDPFVPRELAPVTKVTFTTLERALETDVVVCLLPLTPATDRMIDRRALAHLRPGAVFVNVSRGRVVDSDALVARLAEGDVAAALDVFDPEPIPRDAPIRRLRHVFLSPHIAGVTAESRRRFFSLMTDELLRHFRGDEPQHLLTPEIGRLRHEGRPGSDARDPADDPASPTDPVSPGSARDAPDALEAP